MRRGLSLADAIDAYRWRVRRVRGGYVLPLLDKADKTYQHYSVTRNDGTLGGTCDGGTLAARGLTGVGSSERKTRGLCGWI